MSSSELTRRRSMALVASLFVWPCRSGLSDDPTCEDRGTEEDFRRDIVAREAQSLKLSFDGDEPDVILVDKPLLRWANNVRGGPGGGTFLWTCEGLPVAMCCVWWAADKQVHLAFHSLTEKPIRADRDGGTIWHSAKPGVEYHHVPGAPAVARSAPARLTQLRNIAREFDAALVFSDQRTEELRLLPQPLYRYPGDDSKIKDGGVFAFATGTDPELILQIEAVGGESEALHWRYAVTRRTGFALRVSHQKKLIWTGTVSEGAFDEPFYIRPAR